jgi:hypothetical protein
MAYTRWQTTWVNLPTQTTPANAGFLQHVEDTFVSHDGRITTLESAGPGTGSVISVAGRTGTVVLTKSDVGLNNVDNTSDTNKPVSIAQSSALSAKADLVSGKIPTSQLASGTASGSTFFRGDGTWSVPPSGSGGGITSVAGKVGPVVTLVPADVGLGNVNNTTDAAKPVSVAQAAADALAIPKSTVVNVGDLIIGSGTGIVSKLGVSFTDGDLLTADSTNSTQGMNWKTPPSVYGIVQDEGVILTQQNVLNFKGTYVTAVNDGANNRTNITIADPPAQTVVTPADHNMIAWSYAPELATGSLVVPVGNLMLIKLKINVSVPITSIWWGIVTAGVSPVAGQNEVAIYSSAGTKLTSVNVDASIISTGIKQTTFTAITPAAGFIWVSFLFNAATNPVLPRATSLGIAAQLINAGLTAANYVYGIGGTTQTVSPSSITPTSNTQGTAYWVAVS